MTVLRLEHIGIVVDDLAAASAFGAGRADHSAPPGRPPRRLSRWTSTGSDVRRRPGAAEHGMR
jgi:hypothetical protein